jgi:hypothetical protein
MNRSYQKKSLATTIFVDVTYFNAYILGQRYSLGLVSGTAFPHFPHGTDAFFESDHAHVG